MSNQGDQQSGSDALFQELKALHPMMIDLSLDRLTGLLEALGRPQDRLSPVIHVAGTNGKGSVCAYLTAILQAAGLRVHLYTSPHLVRFHERIALAGADGRTAPIGDSALRHVLQRVQAANAGRAMTFFEMTTAAALLAFSETPADVVILEVGLGGRLDATNVVEKPAVTVITPVALDHADKLGDSVAAIAREKAGIIKPGVPCVVGPQEDEAFLVIQSVAEREGAPLIAWGQDFDAFPQNGRLIFQDEGRLMDLPIPVLRGRHQMSNAGIAIAGARAFARAVTDSRIDEAAIAVGLTTASWPGRMMPVTSGPLRAQLGADDELWIDGGHNPAAGRAIAGTIADLEDAAPKPTFLVAGLLANKDARGFFAPFAGLARALIAVPIGVSGETGSGAAPETIVAAAEAVGISARAAPSLPDALGALQQAHRGPKRVLICGSLYLAGEALKIQNGADVS